MTSSTDDETGSERSRHRSSDRRIARWRRRHEDEVAELDPAEVAALMQRAAQADREPVSAARDALERADVDDPATRRVISDALEVGLVDPSPVDDRRHLLPRRRGEGDRPAVPPPDEGAARRPGPDMADLEARVQAAEARAEDYAAELRRAGEDLAAAEERASELSAGLEQSEERSRTLAAETAARATEHSERVRALVAEREAAEERARSLAEQAAAGADAQVAAAPDDAAAALAESLAAAEERIRVLNQDAIERNALHSERIDALLADVEAADSAAEEARRVAQHAEARIAALERQLGEAHVLPTYAPVEPLGEAPVEELVASEPGPEIEVSRGRGRRGAALRARPNRNPSRCR